MQTQQLQTHLDWAQPGLQLTQTKQQQTAGCRLLCRHSSSTQRQAQAPTRMLWLRLRLRLLTQHRLKLMLGQQQQEEEQQRLARRFLLC